MATESDYDSDATQLAGPNPNVRRRLCDIQTPSDMSRSSTVSKFSGFHPQNLDDNDEVESGETSGTSASSKKRRLDTRKRRNMILWQHFTDSEISKGQKRDGRGSLNAGAVCQVIITTDEHPAGKKCGEVLGRGQGSTGSMRNHLKNRHPAVYGQVLREETQMNQHIDQGRVKLQEAAQEHQAYNAMRIGMCNLLIL